MAALSVGLDLGGTNARAAVVDGAGRIVASHKLPVQDRTPAGVVETLGACVDVALATAGVPPGTVTRFGAGIAGQVDAHTGRILVAPNLGWRDVDLAAPLAARLGGDVVLANDLAAATLGEATDGAARGHRDALLVFVGSGIGAGMVLDGRPYRGTRGVGGELGHVKVVPNGRKCGCGERGCVEAYAGGHNFAAWAREEAAKPGSITTLKEHGDALTAGEVLAAAESGDPLAVQLRAQAAEWIGLAAANAVTLLNPSVVVLGGGVLLGSRTYRAMVENQLKFLCSRVSADGLSVVVPALGDDAGLIGAARLVA